MNSQQVVLSLLGGLLIGVSVTLMLLFNGRVTGISGIVATSLTRLRADEMWRWMFLAGLLSGGVLLYLIRPDLLVNTSLRSVGAVGVAGLLVGYGTLMGGGCTSGHGVCGISRWSVRSLVATGVFMFFGLLSVLVVHLFFGDMV